MAKAKASFEGVIPSSQLYAYLGYYNHSGDPGLAGFNFGDMYVFTEALTDLTDYSDTGFAYGLHGDAAAFTTGKTHYYSQGDIFSPTTETFNLKTGDFTAAWNIQTVTFTGYKANRHKHSISVVINEMNQTVVNFANYGKDFGHIVKLDIFSDKSTGSSVGNGSYVGNGWTVVVDNLKVHWNGAVPGHIGTHAHVSHAVTGAMQQHGSNSHVDSGGHGSTSYYRSEITSLAHHDHGAVGLTDQFHLPQSEHIGV